jgi:hypothetical protein
MTHPSDETLLFYMFGTLEGAAVPSCAEHLRTCRACASRYSKLGDGLEKLDAWSVEEESLEGALDAARLNALEVLKGRETAPAVAPATIAPETVPATPAPVPSFSALAWLGLKPGLEWRAMRLAMFVVAVLGLTWGTGGGVYLAAGPAQGVSVTVERALLVEGTALVRIDAHSGSQPVRISLKTAKGSVVLFEGRTAADGTIAPAVVIPLVSETTGTIEVKVGAEVLYQEVELLHRYRMHLGADKPAYQPGQTMHLRALVLRDPTLMPAGGQRVMIDVRDAKNSTVAHRELTAKIGRASCRERVS